MRGTLVVFVSEYALKVNYSAVYSSSVLIAVCVSVVVVVGLVFLMNMSRFVCLLCFVNFIGSRNLRKSTGVWVYIFKLFS